MYKTLRAFRVSVCVFCFFLKKNAPSGKMVVGQTVGAGQKKTPTLSQNMAAVGDDGGELSADAVLFKAKELQQQLQGCAT
jgi:hypothetical protein